MKIWVVWGRQFDSNSAEGEEEGSARALAFFVTESRARMYASTIPIEEWAMTFCTKETLHGEAD